jgi:NAD(P)H-dependent flavin oxidoreductase YrpB (nitropropane dioxygenase family)
MLKTRFTDLVGCVVPVQQAGMGWIAGPDLAAAVAKAGGLGMLAMPMVPAPALAAMLDTVRSRTTRPVGVTFLAPFLDPAGVEVAACSSQVVEFFYGTPDPDLVRLVHRGGALASWQIGSLAEACAAADAGCDLLVVQGTEAGGHVRGRLPLIILLRQVVDALPEVPVVAAGGIGTARAMADALLAGADGVRVGTRFVATPEADAHPSYIEALVQARAEDTVLTTAFSEMWPDAPHRVLASCIARAEALTDHVVGQVTMAGSTVSIPRLAPIAPTRTTTGALDAMSLYAGQGVDSVRRVEPAGDIVRELAAGAEALLRVSTGSAVRRDVRFGTP